jgi:hypothetical protein
VGVTDFWGMAEKGDENTCEFLCSKGLQEGCRITPKIKLNMETGAMPQ